MLLFAFLVFVSSVYLGGCFHMLFRLKEEGSGGVLCRKFIKVTSRDVSQGHGNSKGKFRKLGGIFGITVIQERQTMSLASCCL